MSGIYSVVEPGFIARSRHRRQHLKKIAAAEEETAKIVRDRDATRVGKQLHKKAEAKRTLERAKQLDHDNPTSDFKADLVLEAGRQQLLRELEAFRLRRKNEVEARDERLRIEEERLAALKEEERKRQREWRIKHYGEQNELLLAEAADLRTRQAERHSARNAALLARDAAETEQFERDVLADQGVGPATSSAISLPPARAAPPGAEDERLGVFGVPLEPDEFHSIALGGHRPGLDDKPVKLFTDAHQMSHDELYRDLHNAEGVHSEKVAKLAAARRDADVQGEQLRSLELLLKRLKMELGQLQEEHESLLKLQADPPRRDPNETERAATHHRKGRITALRKRVGLLDHQAGLVRRRRGELEARAATLEGLSLIHISSPRD